MKLKKVLQKFLTTHNKHEVSSSYVDEVAENAINEAIEARLAAMVANAPESSNPWILQLQVDRLATVSVYTGCQTAGPQIAS